MAFVKLDCGILNSTLWFEREAREIFITALLMAEPIELREEMPQICVDSLEFTGWSVPVGWYGFVPAASVGIIHRARVPEDLGMKALKLLGDPEKSSRSKDFDGRRLVRVDGGFIVLNFMKYRERDYTAAERSKRYRERKASRRNVTPSHRDITQAEEEVEAEAKQRNTPLNPPATATDSCTENELANDVKIEEEHLFRILLGLQNSGEDVQAVCDSLDRPKGQAAFNAHRALISGRSGIPPTEKGLTVRRRLIDALEARQRAQSGFTISENNRKAFDAIDRVADRLVARRDGKQVKELEG